MIIRSDNIDMAVVKDSFHLKMSPHSDTLPSDFHHWCVFAAVQTRPRPGSGGTLPVHPDLSLVCESSLFYNKPQDRRMRPFVRKRTRCQWFDDDKYSCKMKG